MNRKSFNFILTVIIFIVFTVGYIFFLQTEQFQQLFQLAQQNFVLFVSLLFLLKVLGNIYPPLPAGMLTLAAIPILGWKVAYAVDFFGSLVSGIICYWLGMKYGQKILRMVFDEPIIEKINKLKLKTGKEIEGIIVTRILTGGTIIEAIYYGAGLLKVNFKKFLAGIIISHILVGVPTYYFGGQFFSSGNLVLNGIFIVSAVFVLYKLKGRYFE